MTYIYFLWPVSRGIHDIYDLRISSEDFKASNGWLCRFRQIHNSSMGTLSGESAGVS